MENPGFCGLDQCCMNGAFRAWWCCGPALRRVTALVTPSPPVPVLSLMAASAFLWSQQPVPRTMETPEVLVIHCLDF